MQQLVCCPQLFHTLSACLQANLCILFHALCMLPTTRMRNFTLLSSTHIQHHLVAYDEVSTHGFLCNSSSSYNASYPLPRSLLRTFTGHPLFIYIHIYLILIKNIKPYLQDSCLVDGDSDITFLFQNIVNARQMFWILFHECLTFNIMYIFNKRKKIFICKLIENKKEKKLWNIFIYININAHIST